MATLDSIRTLYKYTLQDKGLTLEEINGTPPSPANDVRDKVIAEAINWYGRRVPRIRTSLVQPLAAGFYELPLDWQVWSRIVSVEFPLDQNPPAIYPKKSIGFQAREVGTFFFLNPNPGSAFRLSYLTVHGGGSDNVSSISDDHEPIIAKYAAGLAGLDFAARYANSVSNNVDSVQYRTKEQEWRSVAKALMDQADVEIRQHEWALLYATEADARYNKSWRA